MLEWDILNYLKKWRTNLRATHPVGKPVYLRLEQPDDPGFCNHLPVIPHTGTQSAHHLHQVVIRPLLLGKRVQITGGEDTPYLPDIRFFKIHP